MPFLTPIRFEGSLSGHGNTVPVGFSAEIDDLGRLQLQLDRLPATAEVFALRANQRPGTPVDWLALDGESADGRSFQSDSFHMTSWNHGSDGDLPISYQGDCADAVIGQEATGDTGRDARIWLVRQLRTWRGLERNTALGRVVIGGPRQDREAQEPNGFLAIHHPTGRADEGWWEQSERFLTHLARVMSFACDTYILPSIEQRFAGGRVDIRVVQRGRAGAPYMPPFYDLHMQPIFDCACASFFDRYCEIEALDAAIRWLTAPVTYEEARLIDAMSAIENVLSRSSLPEVQTFLNGSQFKKVASRVRALLAELKAPGGMADKILELNRPSLEQKVTALLSARGIATSDLPDNWLRTIITARNAIIHTGIVADAGESEPDTLDHIIWTREIVHRIILERLGFVGAYRSWLHHDEQLHFPECVPMADFVASRHDLSLQA